MIGNRIEKLRKINSLSRRDLEKLTLTVDEFSLQTGIKSGQISSIENNRQKLYGWQIQAISTVWPQYAYWLTTGQTLPEAGQISPAQNEVPIIFRVGDY